MSDLQKEFTHVCAVYTQTDQGNLLNICFLNPSYMLYSDLSSEVYRANQRGVAALEILYSGQSVKQ